MATFLAAHGVSLSLWLSTPFPCRQTSLFIPSSTHPHCEMLIRVVAYRSLSTTMYRTQDSGQCHGVGRHVFMGERLGLGIPCQSHVVYVVVANLIDQKLWAYSNSISPLFCFSEIYFSAITNTTGLENLSTLKAASHGTMCGPSWHQLHSSCMLAGPF